MDKEAARQTARLCALCVHSCKQRPDCTVVKCPDFKRKTESATQKDQAS